MVWKANAANCQSRLDIDMSIDAIHFVMTQNGCHALQEVFRGTSGDLAAWVFADESK